MGPRDDRRLRCPLCGEPAAGPPGLAVRWGKARRRYHLCPACRLIHLDPGDRLDSASEAQRYRLHRNSPRDEGYRAFLGPLVAELVERLASGARGLDFGCGPEPVLAELLSRHGFACDLYDPLFHPQPPAPPYDFIAASEVFEHFHHPAREMERWRTLLRPGGLLGIMTERWESLEFFARWPYTSDPTHVCFLHDATLDWISRHLDLEERGRTRRTVVWARR